MQILLKIIRVLFFILAFFLLLGVFYPAVGMSKEQLLQGRIALAVASAIFFTFGWLISKAISKNDKISFLTPYKIEEVGDWYIYEYKTIFMYSLYLVLALMVFGYFANISILSIVGTLLMFIYFLLISTQYRAIGKKVKSAAASGSVEISGSKWSFSNPLKVKINREYA